MITVEEHGALRAFARLYGRTWRRELARRWENGTLLLSQVSVSEDQLSALVRLKSKLGPSGLQRYKLPAEEAEEASPSGAGSPSSVGRRSRTRMDDR